MKVNYVAYHCLILISVQCILRPGVSTSTCTWYLITHK